MTRARDEDGYLEPGDLVSGGYGAIEADLGEKLRPLAGFGRDLEPPVEEEIWEGVVFTPSTAFQTIPGMVVYEMKGFDG